MAQLGANAFGEVLEPGWVPDCYLGLLLADDVQGPGVLVVAPASLLHSCVPQPDGTVLYALVTGHPDREPGELVFLAELTRELRAWPRDTWAKVGVDPQAAAAAVVAGWQRGDLLGLRLGGLTTEEALALGRRQAAKAVAAVYMALILAPGGWSGWWIGRLQPERSVGTVDVVVLDVDPKHLLQVPAPNDQQPAQAIGPDRPDPALGVGVGVGRLHRRDQDVCALRPEHLVERPSELRVPVAEQKPWALPLR